jgi:hypothetical protein
VAVVEIAALKYVTLDFPADTLRYLDAPGIATGFNMTVNI